jgi:hypothetical protein
MKRYLLLLHGDSSFLESAGHSYGKMCSQPTIEEIYTDNAILPTQVNASDVIQFCSTINDIVAIEEECPEN